MRLSRVLNYSATASFVLVNYLPVWSNRMQSLPMHVSLLSYSTDSSVYNKKYVTANNNNSDHSSSA